MSKLLIHLMLLWRVNVVARAGVPRSRIWRRRHGCDVAVALLRAGQSRLDEVLVTGVGSRALLNRRMSSRWKRHVGSIVDDRRGNVVDVALAEAHRVAVAAVGRRDRAVILSHRLIAERRHGAEKGVKSIRRPSRKWRFGILPALS